MLYAAHHPARYTPDACSTEQRENANNHKETEMTAASKKATSKKSAAPQTSTIAEVHLVPLDLIDINEQIRTEFDQESIEDLAKDIEARGLMQPVLLNPNGDRFTMIAGERRLRAIKLNGQNSIPALIAKVSTDEAMLMQLAENIQREDLSFQDECKAINKIYEVTSSLKKVAVVVKKSIPWCSKRFSANKNLGCLAERILEEGITEDLEILKGIKTLEANAGWTAANEMCEKIRKGEAGRNEVRAAVKVAKEKKKEEAAASNPGKVSQAKIKTSPPPPVWEIEDAMEEISRALTYVDAEESAVDLINSWTEEQQQSIKTRLMVAAAEGATAEGFKEIGRLVLQGFWESGKIDVDLMAMIAGNSGKPFEWMEFLTNLQTPREKA
jgi:ParB/RepB/Spo0J family partition protein